MCLFPEWKKYHLASKQSSLFPLVEPPTAPNYETPPAELSIRRANGRKCGPGGHRASGYPPGWPNTYMMVDAVLVTPNMFLTTRGEFCLRRFRSHLGQGFGEGGIDLVAETFGLLHRLPGEGEVLYPKVGHGKQVMGLRQERGLGVADI